MAVGQDYRGEEAGKEEEKENQTGGRRRKVEVGFALTAHTYHLSPHISLKCPHIASTLAATNTPKHFFIGICVSEQ